MTSVAHVAVDVPLPHLDRVFDYEIPEAMAASARPGHRVRVRFSGRLVDGFIVDVGDSSGHRLQPLQRVVTDYPVLTPEVLRLCRAVADRYAGSLADVLRAAIPPRHARAEKSASAALSAERLAPPVVAEAWTSYVGGPALLARLAAGSADVHAVLTCAPGGAVDPAGDWPALLADIAGVAAPHRGVVIVVPDARDLQRADAALTAALGPGRHAVLSADLGPQRRYSQFLEVLSGRVRIVLGTRAAAFAPVVDPGVFVIWDDGDESLSEPHSPGWHAREVLALRAHLCGGAVVAAGFTRTAETQLWLETRWAAPVTPRRDLLRRIAPRVVADDSSQDAGPARLPHRAWEAAKTALGRGPVLVQVARRGYVPALACQDCRSPARCPRCSGPLSLEGAAAQGSVPACRWCGDAAPGWRCPCCGSARLRAVAVGSRRTAE
ncbi:MAG: primosome assembly protein PriA, partial [bacterium]